MKEKLRSLLTQYKTPIRIVLCAFVVILIVLALLTYVPITKTMRYDMRGFIVSADGEIQEEFDFTVTCKEYNFIIDPPGGSISFSGNKLVELERDAFVLYFDWGTSSIAKRCLFGHFTDSFRITDTKMIGSLMYYDSKSNSSALDSGFFDAEYGTICIHTDVLASNAFIVGTTDPQVDPNALIQSYKHHLGDPTIDKLQKIDWTMTGAMVSGNGEVLRSCNLSITGDVTLGKNGEDQLDLNIRFPKLFEYWYDGPAVYTSQSRRYFNTPYPVCSSYAYNRDTNDPDYSVFALCPEKEYVIFNWDDGKDQYLVASTDPNVSPQEILSYFATYMEKFNIDD